MLEPMALFFENRLAGYDEHMYTAIEGAEEFYRFTAEQLPTAPGCEILDLGCGTGLELEPFFPRNPTARITGIDLSQGMLAALREKFPGKSLRLIHGSYFDTPLGMERYDAAVSVESLHHFPAEQKQALYKNLLDALRPGGFFILTDYFAESEALEREYAEALQHLKAQQGIRDGGFYHYDTPLTVEHEIRVLTRAGFSHCRILASWGATHTVRAVK